MTKLKEQRRTLHFTQKQVAEKIGVSYQQYQGYENGRFAPNVYMAIEIAKALDSTVEKLFKRE